MSYNGGDIGIGYGRVAYAGRWGVVGENPVNWGYREVFDNGNCEGIFLSPQLLTALSEGRANPRYSIEKADVFALGIMLV